MSFLAGWIDYAKGMTANINAIDQMSKCFSGGISVYTDTCVALLAREIATKKVHSSCYTAIFCGQIYNTQEIIAKLDTLGHSLDNSTAVQVVLNAYIAWGQDCLDHFNGTFSLAIWEAESKSLFLARDRVGVAPLFYIEYGGGIVFATDIKTLVASGMCTKEVDRAGLMQLVLLGPGRSMGAGIIKGVKELKAGTCLIRDAMGIKERCYWRLKAYRHEDNLATTVDTTRHLIDESIIKQLNNCTCCMLSGGLDSSIISMVAAKHYKDKCAVSTYSVDYQDSEYNFVQNSYQPSRDNKYIALMQEFIGSQHQYVVLDNLEVAKSIVDASSARGFAGMGDIDSSLLLFLQEIKKEHNICLSGECADELFGGYPWYWSEELLYKDTFPWSDATDMRVKLFKGAGLAKDAHEFVQSEYQKTVDYTDYLASDAKLDRRIREMFMLNFYHFMQTLVERSVTMSKSLSMEVRMPFCDHKLAEYAFNMPWAYKALHGREKGVLREAYKDLLPHDVVYRKKNPYPKTFSPIFSDHVTTQAKRLIYDNDSVLSVLVDKEFFEDLQCQRVVLDRPWYGQLMQVPQIFAYLIQLDAFFNSHALRLV